MLIATYSLSYYFLPLYRRMRLPLLANRRWGKDPIKAGCKQALPFFCFFFLLFEGTFTSFFKDESHKEAQNSNESEFFLLLCLMIGGSGSGLGSGLVSVPL